VNSKEINLIAKEYIAAYWNQEAEAKFPYKSLPHHRN